MTAPRIVNEQGMRQGSVTRYLSATDTTMSRPRWHWCASLDGTVPWPAARCAARVMRS
jgi:hypothetical protein